MPKIGDVVSDHVDKSCQCRLDEESCFIVDAVAGRYEGRDLSCRIVSRDRRTVRCRFEERFVEWLSEDGERPGEWRSRDAVFRNFDGSLWCLES